MFTLSSPRLFGLLHTRLGRGQVATPGSISRWLLSLYSVYTTVAVYFLPDSIVQGLAVIKRNFMVKSHFSLKWSYNGVSLFVLKVTQK